MSHRRHVFILRLLDEWALIGATLDPLFMPTLCPLNGTFAEGSLGRHPPAAFAGLTRILHFKQSLRCLKIAN